MLRPKPWNEWERQKWKVTRETFKPELSDLCLFVCVKSNFTRKIQGSAGLGGWRVLVIPELRQVGERWGREDQKFKAFLNFKASGRPPGLLDVLL